MRCPTRHPRNHGRVHHRRHRLRHRLHRQRAGQGGADCWRRKIQIIATGGAGGQVDPTQIQVADLNKTFNDPLRRRAFRVANTTSRARRGAPTACPAFSTEQLRYPKPDGGVCQSKSFVGEGVKLDCAGGGAVTMVTATFGISPPRRRSTNWSPEPGGQRAQRPQLMKTCRSRSAMRLPGKFRCHKALHISHLADIRRRQDCPQHKEPISCATLNIKGILDDP